MSTHVSLVLFTLCLMAIALLVTESLEQWISTVCLIILAICAALVMGCSGGSPKPAHSLEWSAKPNGLTSLRFHGVELSAGGYYAIGSCTGIDDLTSVDSRVGDGRALRPREGSCPPIPWTFTSFRLGPNALRVHAELGPTPQAYATISIPLDLRKEHFVAYAFSEGPLWVNGDSRQQSAPGGLYTDIPQPYTIPILVPPANKVGFVHARRQAAWVEASGPAGRVRRVFNPGISVKDTFVFRHPATHNLEASFGPVPVGTVPVIDEDIIAY